jgi:hypothetical protein
MAFKRRRTVKQYSYRCRFLGLSCKNVIQLKFYKCALIYLTFILSLNKNFSRKQKDCIRMCSMFIFYKYRELVVEPAYSLLPLVRKDRTIESFHIEEMYHNFRFRSHADMRLLFDCLRIPWEVKVDNGEVFSGEEIFLFCLMRLCTNYTLDALAKNHFGRDYSIWSRVFKWFLLHLHGLFYDLMHNNLDFWVPYFPSCAAAIRSKLAKFGLHFSADQMFLIFSFIDDNCFETCRPRGPTETKKQYKMQHYKRKKQ